MANCITECDRCGCRTFHVVETIKWWGEVDRQGFLDAMSHPEHSESVCCAQCGKSYAPERFGNSN